VSYQRFIASSYNLKPENYIDNLVSVPIRIVISFCGKLLYSLPTHGALISVVDGSNDVACDDPVISFDLQRGAAN
jgi:hypothetical protein